MDLAIFYTKKGSRSWRLVSEGMSYKKMVYEHTSQKLYVSSFYNCPVQVWSFSGDEPQQIFGDCPPDGMHLLLGFLPDRSKDEELYLKERKFYMEEYVTSRLYIAVSTVSGQFLKVVNMLQKSKKWFFLVHKIHPTELTWEVVDSLGR
ncbi:unnamed protein product [Brassica oleracea var. botrytis]